jgi:hypothetical protein
LNFLGGLSGVATVGKHARRSAGNGQGGIGACESAEIAYVREMGNQEARETRAGKLAAKCADASQMIHGVCFITVERS